MAKWQGGRAQVINAGEELPINRMKRITKPDGVTVLIDTGVRKTKKNRHRHCKDGTPKRLRGTAVTRLYDCSGQEAYEEVNLVES